MRFDLARVPFSRFGSYLAFSLLPEAASRPAGLYLRSVRGPATGGRPLQELLRLELARAGRPLAFTTTATPTLLRLEAEGAWAEVCLPHPATVRVRVQGADLSFTLAEIGAYDNLVARSTGPGRARGPAWLLTANTVCETKLTFTPLAGGLRVDAPWEAERCVHITLTLPAGGELAIDEDPVEGAAQEHPAPFEVDRAQVTAEYEAWVARLPTVPPQYAPARELAGYVLWSCAVAPAGDLQRPAIYASKNGMLGVWSWDHAFHALALADAHPEQAWDQFLSVFDHQTPSGALPDLINDRLVSWSFCKPPVHGWILDRLLRTSALLTPERLRDLYPRLAAWTRWWLARRDAEGDLPQCYHGNDSGWDNSTVFAGRPPVQTPELAAYLVVQLEFLADAAGRLGQPQEAAAWRAQSQALTAALLAHFWRGGRFVAVASETGRPILSDSLLLYLPLLLGRRLPADVRAALITDLTAAGRFLTEYGLATEALTSPHYRSRGYWRGPIWPAPTLILIDALRASGAADLAADLRRRFCDLVAREGMAENFDAVTGAGYHDFHFSWTAAIFLVLAHELDAHEEP